MTPHTFRKTLLALAITGTTLSAQAATETIDGFIILKPAYSDSVSVTGSREGEFKVDLAKQVGEVVKAEKSNLAKDLSINANINVQGDGIGAVGLFDTSIGGNLTIEGTMNVKGGLFTLKNDPEVEVWGVAGVILEGDAGWDSIKQERVYYHNVGGSLLNKASISVDGAGATGLAVWEMSIGGDIVNEGTIQATAADVVSKFEEVDEKGNKWTTEGVLGVQAVEIGYSKVGGNIHNKGTIRAESTNARGLEINTVKFGKFINDGSIEVKGVASELKYTDSVGAWTEQGRVVAVNLDDADLQQFRNNAGGRIIASGKDSVALSIMNGTIANTGDEAQIVNAGLIQAEGTAVEIDNVYTDKKQLEILNLGDIVSTSGGAAIEAYPHWSNKPVHLRWENGTISGDLQGLGQIDVLGTVAFKGDINKPDDKGKSRGYSYINVKNGGQLALRKPHTQINGSLDVDAKSSLALGLSAETDAKKPVLQVSDAKFEDGAQIKVSSTGKDGDYILLQAETLTNAGLGVTSSSLLHSVASSVKGTQVLASVAAKSEAEILQSIIGSGSATQGDKNAAKAAGALLSALGQLPADDLIVQILHSGTPEQQKQLLKQLSPDVNGGAARAAVSSQSLIGSATAGRTGGARGMSSGDAVQQVGAWVQALNSDATQDLRDGVAGYEASTTGIAVGADGKLNEQLTVGLAYSMLDSDVDVEGGNSTKVTGHAFTLYSGFAQDGLFVDGSLTYGLNENESKRYVNDVNQARHLAKAEYDSSLLGVSLTAGYSYPLQGSVVVEPQVTARYSNVEIDAIKETGASTALNTAAQTYNMAELGAGARLVGSLPLGQGTLEPQLKAMVYQELIGDEVETTSTFAVGGNSFVTTGADPETTSYEIGLGADYRLGALTLGVSYNYFGRSDYNSDTFGAKVRYDF